MLLEMHLKALLQDAEPPISRYCSSPSLLALKCLPLLRKSGIIPQRRGKKTYKVVQGEGENSPDLQPGHETEMGTSVTSTFC